MRNVFGFMRSKGSGTTGITGTCSTQWPVLLKESESSPGTNHTWRYRMGPKNFRSERLLFVLFLCKIVHLQLNLASPLRGISKYLPQFTRLSNVVHVYCQVICEIIFHSPSSLQWLLYIYSSLSFSQPDKQS